MAESTSAVTVAVRCRPFSQKETDEGSVCCISMSGNTTTISDPAGKIKPLSFAFDHSFWSGKMPEPTTSDSPTFASQQIVFDHIGRLLLDNTFNGFNGCLFAYGQTGSGKTYSMLGYGDEKGIIPRLCDELFERANAKQTETDGAWTFQAEVSYLEIYNEKCRCLLAPTDPRKQSTVEYKVREHPVTGPYVENLTKIVVKSFEEIERIMEEGNRTRTVASTNMNATSSRSHAIFTVVVKQATTHKSLNNAKSELTSKLNLVDLAGSERADRTGATGKTLKEGSNINQSLTTLGKVINGLAEGGGKGKHIPFRDSALTWILKENLCGNSKTIMLAALSPATSNYEETVSTLRYADRAKNLRTVAVVNEDPSSKKIRELTAEIEKLRALLQDSTSQQASPNRVLPPSEGDGSSSPRLGESGVTSPRSAVGPSYESLSLKEKIELAQKLLLEEGQSWEERAEHSDEVQQLRDKVAKKQGVKRFSVAMQQQLPSLVNLNEDPLLTECLMYVLEEGELLVGTDVEDSSRDVLLGGDGIRPKHAKIVVQRNVTAEEGEHSSGEQSSSTWFTTTLIPLAEDGTCYVNGVHVKTATQLHNNDRVIFGGNQFFRFRDTKVPSTLSSSNNNRANTTTTSEGDGPNGAASPVRPVDYQRALEERFQQERLEMQRQQAALEERISNEKRLREEQEARMAELERQRAEQRQRDEELRLAELKRVAEELEQRQKEQQQQRATSEQQVIREMEERLRELEEKQKGSLSNKFLTQTSVKSAMVSDPSASLHRPPPQHADPNSIAPHMKMHNSLIQAAHIAGVKTVRLANQQIFRQKIVLLGHQEVGKTSLRKCFESDPLFFMKKLPDVKSTTGIENQEKELRIQDEKVFLTISDFAGQEAYHSHTMFLTSRSLFVLVWKISAVEQDFQSVGISEHEEKRLQRWIAEVYAKFPTAKICLIATHLDELRDQSQKGVEMILSKVERLMVRFMESIARRDVTSGRLLTNELIGNFAVSCKQRTFLGAGKHRHLSGGKLSVLLQVLGESSYQSCMSDEDFRCGAIPGRHIRLKQDIEERKVQHPTQLMLSLSEYVHMAVRCGVESDEELLQISLLLHSWNIIYLFNLTSISDNVFIFMHPPWLCRLAGVLFSFAHVLQTPLHLRSIIGGLEYSVTQAENADMHMMSKGFLRLPLAKVLFRKALSDFLKREPEEADFDMALKLLSAMSLIEAVQISCDDIGVLFEETPGTPRRNTKNISDHMHRYFVPSLSPFSLPDELHRTAALVFHSGVKVKFEFNMLPNEMWWKLQARLQNHQQVISVRCPVDPDEDDEELDETYRLPEADDHHNRWRDAMWLQNSGTRVLLVREGLRGIRFYSVEGRLVEGQPAADDLLKIVEETVTDLLREYRGIQRTIFVLCPIPTCTGWHDVNVIEPGTLVTCHVCREQFEAEAAVVSGNGPLGSHIFSAAAHSEACDMLSFALDEKVCQYVCTHLGISYHPPLNSTSNANTRSSAAAASDDGEPIDFSRVDILQSLDKLIRAMILRQVWKKSNEFH